VEKFFVTNLPLQVNGEICVRELLWDVKLKMTVFD